MIHRSLGPGRHLLIALSILLFHGAMGFAASDQADWVSLDGKPAAAPNAVAGDGLIHEFHESGLMLFKSEAATVKGTILLCPGGGYSILNMTTEGPNTARFLNEQAFDVALLEYHISAGPQTRELALTDALTAYRLIRSDGHALGLHGGRFGIMGYSAGGHLAARTAQVLAPDEQPQDLILVYPAYLNECIGGTVIPSVAPPTTPRRLFALIAANDNADWVSSITTYSKTWKGFDGLTTFTLLPDGGHGFGVQADAAKSTGNWPQLLATFLQNGSQPAAGGVDRATVPVEGGAPDRHAQKVALSAKEKFDLILVGDSITNNFDNPQFQAVWNQFFAPRHAVNLGYSGYRTENLIWNLQHGELDGQSPKLITLMIGTNNVDEKHYPRRDTAGQVADGIGAIIKILRDKCPEAKILLLRIFPGSYDGANPTSHRAILDRASELSLRFVDNQHVFFCDVNHLFIKLDGEIDQNLMSDYLHPNPAGAMLWAQAMEPMICDLMGDVSHDTHKPDNSAIIPAPKLEEDGYDWLGRHDEILRIKEKLDPDVVLIGDSITHAWGGVPVTGARTTGESVLNSTLGKYRVLNMGFGWDRTQNVLWRLDHGELEGLHPRAIVINIGTNNTSETPHARKNTAAEIVAGIEQICIRVRSESPRSRIILMAIFPREHLPTDPRRVLIDETNRLLADFAKKAQLDFVDIGPKLLAPDGTLPQSIAPDFCHPTAAGYQIWADAILPLIGPSR